jgi:hypothetical protein
MKKTFVIKVKNRITGDVITEEELIYDLDEDQYKRPLFFAHLMDETERLKEKYIGTEVTERNKNGYSNKRGEKLFNS